MFQRDMMFQMKEHLDGIVKDGISLYLDGREISPQELAWTCCVNEDAVYMPDYVLDQNGKIKELRYDRLKHL